MKFVEIEGITYRIGDLTVFDQLNLARRLTPLSMVIQGMMTPENAEKDHTIMVILMLSKLSDDDSEYVVSKCLSVVMRQDGKDLAKLQTPQGQLMYQDITMKIMVNLATEVILENLGDFFHTALSVVKEGATG